MDLHDTEERERCLKRGYESAIEVAAGQSLKIETSPHGSEILDVECPRGKVWILSINVCIEECDA